MTAVYDSLPLPPPPPRGQIYADCLLPCPSHVTYSRFIIYAVDATRAISVTLAPLATAVSPAAPTTACGLSVAPAAPKHVPTPARELTPPTAEVSPLLAQSDRASAGRHSYVWLVEEVNASSTAAKNTSVCALLDHERRPLCSFLCFLCAVWLCRSSLYHLISYPLTIPTTIIPAVYRNHARSPLVTSPSRAMRVSGDNTNMGRLQVRHDNRVPGRPCQE